MPHSDLLFEDFPRLPLIHLHSLICLLSLVNLLAFHKGRGAGGEGKGKIKSIARGLQLFN